MRRAGWWLALLGVGVLVGFIVRLLLPRGGDQVVYLAPVADPLDPVEFSEARRSG